jgi:hypothetical protein
MGAAVGVSSPISVSIAKTEEAVRIGQGVVAVPGAKEPSKKIIRAIRPKRIVERPRREDVAKYIVICVRPKHRPDPTAIPITIETAPESASRETIAYEAIAEAVGGEIASAESAAPSEIVTTPVVCEAGMSNGVGPKSMRTGEMAQTSPAMGVGAGKVPDTPKMTAAHPAEMPPRHAAEMAATEVAATEVPTTEVPTTGVPTTEVPTTEVPTTEVPTTEVAPSPTKMPAASAVSSAKGHDIVRKRNRHYRDTRHQRNNDLA